MSSRQRGLGKGLGALIPGGEARSGLLEVDVSEIALNPRQPRRDVASENLEELSASIAEHGVLQPLIVTEAATRGEAGGARYQLIAGGRRWRAAILAGLQMVPVMVKEATPQETLELALVENIQRADLNALEEASAFQQLVQEFGLTQEQVAQRVGRSRVSVTNALRLLRLSGQVQLALEEGSITGGHARALLGLPEEDMQLRALREVLRQGLSVRQTEELVRRLLDTGRVRSRQETPVPPETRALEDRFRSSLGTKVSLQRRKRGGRLVIYFFSEEELQALYDRIVGEEM